MDFPLQEPSRRTRNLWRNSGFQNNDGLNLVLVSVGEKVNVEVMVLVRCSIKEKVI